MSRVSSDDREPPTVRPLSVLPPAPSRRVPVAVVLAVVAVALVTVVAAAIWLPGSEAALEPAPGSRALELEELSRVARIEDAWNSGDTARFEDTFVPAWMVAEGIDLDNGLAYHQRFIRAGGIYEFGSCSVIIPTSRMRCAVTLTDRLLLAEGTEYRAYLFFIFDPAGKIVSWRPIPGVIYPESAIEWLHFRQWVDEHHVGADDPLVHLDEYLSELAG